MLCFPLIGVAATASVIAGGVSSWAWVLTGALAWVIAVVIKAVAAPVVGRLAGRGGGGGGPDGGRGGGPDGGRGGGVRRRRAAVLGLWSALCELGLVAAVVLVFPAVSGAAAGVGVGDVVGMGAGAGAAEALILGLIGLLQALAARYDPERLEAPTGPADTTERADGAGPADSADAADPAGPPPGRGDGAVPFFVAWQGVLERLLALAGHIASRGLLWVGLVVPGQGYVIGVAVAFFALVDGVATYGGEAGWHWTDMAVAVRFHGFVAVVTVAECAIFYGYVAG